PPPPTSPRGASRPASPAARSCRSAARPARRSPGNRQDLHARSNRRISPMVGATHMKIIGSYVSPYVRKVLACMALKGVDDYEIDPITPFFGDDEFARLSPLRRIPVLIHEELVLTDSSVIC